MPNRITDHLIVQDTTNTVSRWNRICGDTVSGWIESAVQEWKEDTRRNGRFKTSLWECFDPIDLCLITIFCPCVTCGKTFHRLHYQGDMSEYEIVNAPCLVYGTTCYCCSPILTGLLCSGPLALQTCQVRKEGSIGGTLVLDCLKVWCCNCCSLIQNEKESTILLEGRSVGLGGGNGVVESQYAGGAGAGEKMIMPSHGAQKGSNVVDAEEADELSAMSETGPDTSRQAVDMVDQAETTSSLDGSPAATTTTPHAITSEPEQCDCSLPVPGDVDTQTQDHSVTLPTVTQSPTANIPTSISTSDKQNCDLPLRRCNPAENL